MKSKKAFFLIPLLSLGLSLSGCIFGESSWPDYDTPEEFLSHSQVHPYVTVTCSSIVGEVLDFDMVIKDAILSAAPFSQTDSFESYTDRYFTYEIFLSHSTAGPNFTRMFVYDDGHLLILCKSALGKPSYHYFLFDQDKADALVTFVEGRIGEIIQNREEDKNAANAGATMEAFLGELTGASVIPVRLWEEHEVYECLDDGSLLSLLSQMSFDLVSPYSFSSSALIYNTFVDTPVAASVDTWYLDISSDFRYANLYYFFDNRYEEGDVTFNTYSINENEGRSFYEASLALAKASQVSH